MCPELVQNPYLFTSKRVHLISFSKWHNSDGWIYCPASDDKGRTLVTQTTDGLLCSAVWIPEAVPLNCGSRSALRAPISVLALPSRSSKWVHPKGCFLIRNSLYCDEATGRNVPGLKSGRSKRYFSPPRRSGRLWCPSSRLFNWYPSSSLGVNCEVNHSPPSSAGVANEWSYTCMPPIYLNDGDNGNLIFLFACSFSKYLTFKRRIKSHLPFAGIIRSSPYSPRFQDNG